MKKILRLAIIIFLLTLFWKEPVLAETVGVPPGNQTFVMHTRWWAGTSRLVFRNGWETSGPRLLESVGVTETERPNSVTHGWASDWTYTWDTERMDFYSISVDWACREDFVGRVVGFGHGTATPYDDRIVLRAGDLLNVLYVRGFGGDRLRNMIRVSLNGSVVLGPELWDHLPGVGAGWNIIPTLRGVVEPPIVTASPDVAFEVGSLCSWSDGITATWGISTEKVIPPLGSIDVVSLAGGTDPDLSSDGVRFDKIGTKLHTYEIKDLHSLSTEFPYDNTFSTTSRWITVWTRLSPSLITEYSDTANAGLPGQVYEEFQLNLPCGGEDGWTNQPLDITIDPETIVGSFDTYLDLPDLTTTATNAAATRTYYHIESPNTFGTGISGGLTAVGDASNILSGTVNGSVKIDKTNPIPVASHIGGFNFTDDSTDALSGMSLTRPSEIALSTPSGPQPASGDFSLFGAIPAMQDGTYDIWVRATDKAGNTATERVLSDILLLNGTVELTKDTDQGATLHVVGCPDFEGAAVASCTPECSLGANVEIEEKSSLTYKLTLTNSDLADAASGTFEDYLPEGAVVSTLPTITPAGSATVTFDLETSGPYAGRFKVSGTYTNLAPNGQIEINILTRAPAFDKVTAMNNIITNQASTNWTIGTGPTERSGSTDSNYAVHELLEIPSVETLFTKVGANDLDVGLAGAEFALYRWNGALDPTTAELNHIIDCNVLVDNTLPGGDWVRVTYDGEDALALTDIFVSSASPLGEVDLGSLPEGGYTLIETKTVGGYALPMGQWILTIDPNKDDTGANDWKIEFAGKSNSIAPPAAIRDESVPTAPTYKIVNAEPFLIGLSGLEGTTGMLLTGFIIMAIATNTYLVRRHKQRETQARQETHTF